MGNYDLFNALMQEKSARYMLDVVYKVLKDPSIPSMDKVTTCSHIIEVFLDREET